MTNFPISSADKFVTTSGHTSFLSVPWAFIPGLCLEWCLPLQGSSPRYFHGSDLSLTHFSVGRTVLHTHSNIDSSCFCTTNLFNWFHTKVYPWTTWVWTVWLHLYAVFFFPINVASSSYLRSQPTMDWKRIFAFLTQIPYLGYKTVFSIHGWLNLQTQRADYRVQSYT